MSYGLYFVSVVFSKTVSDGQSPLKFAACWILVTRNRADCLPFAITLENKLLQLSWCADFVRVRLQVKYCQMRVSQISTD